MGRGAWALARRPSLWGEALRALIAVSPAGWWRTFPFLPRAEPAYLAWRVSTAYGSAHQPMRAHDLVAYLEWRRRLRRSR